ncbi:MAG: type I glyceraldehyde-3-phosphate dehydrogenase, partial [Polyangiaceae bacterium]|nr:type I glyceraldehyde-3-phosphate dehydrogenase [Polyangiaceae bacterium]
MATKIGINGFGRIGRCVLRAIVDRGIKDIEVALINDITDDATLAHLLKYDTTFRTFGADVGLEKDAIVVAGRKIKTTAIKDPKEIPWKAEGVDVVLECTGLFTSAEKAKWHLDAGAKKVLVSAPAKGDGVRTIVLGVNDSDYNARTDHILSIGSCTTNCLAPVAKVLLDNFGIKRGLMTTTHSYTNDQNLL